MRNCSEINEMISMYIDDMLDEDTRREVDAHIDGCPSCRNELEELKAVLGMCVELPEVELPQGFGAELHEKLVHEKEKEDRRKQWTVLRNRIVKIGASAAACLVLIVLLQGFFTNNNLMPAESMTKSTQSVAADTKNETYDGLANGVARDGASAYEYKDSTAPAAKEEAAPQADLRVGGMHEESTANKSVKDDKEKVTGSNFNKALDTTAAADQTTISATVQQTSPPNPEAKVMFSQAMDVKEKRTAGVDINMAGSADSVEKVRICVTASGGELYERGTAKYGAAQAAHGEIIISARIPNSRYAQFTDSLRMAFDPVPVEFGAVNGENMADRIDELNKALNELDIKINQLQEPGNVSNADELARLTSEQAGLREELAQIEKDTQVTFVTVVIRQK